MPKPSGVAQYITSFGRFRRISESWLGSGVTELPMLSLLPEAHDFSSQFKSFPNNFNIHCSAFHQKLDKSVRPALVDVRETCQPNSYQPTYRISYPKYYTNEYSHHSHRRNTPILKSHINPGITIARIFIPSGPTIPT